MNNCRSLAKDFAFDRKTALNNLSVLGPHFLRTALALTMPVLMAGCATIRLDVPRPSTYGI